MALMIDWGGKVAAWLGIVCAASIGLATLIAALVKPPLRGWPHTALIMLVVIAAVTFVLLLLTGPRAMWSAWRNRRAQRALRARTPETVQSTAAPDPLPARPPAPQVPTRRPAQQDASAGAILRAARASAAAERERRIHKVYADGQILRGRIAGLGSGHTLLPPEMPADLARWENAVLEALSSQPMRLTRFRSVPELPPFGVRADDAYRRISQQLDIVDPHKISEYLYSSESKELSCPVSPYD